MENTLFLAQFLGSFSIILAVVVILRRKLIVHVFREFLENRTLAFIVGIVEVSGGLLLVLSHSSWKDGLEIVVSIFGWLLLFEGLIALAATKRFLQKFINALDHLSAYYFFASIYLVIGVYLVYVGFGLNL